MVTVCMHQLLAWPSCAVRTDMCASHPGLDYYRDVVPPMLTNGSLSQTLVDRALSRLLTLRFQAGLFDKFEGQKFGEIAPADRGTPAFAEVALDAARQSMTLLLNKDKALPIPRKASLAVIGPYGSYGSAQGGVGGKLSDELSKTWLRH